MRFRVLTRKNPLPDLKKCRVKKRLDKKHFSPLSLFNISFQMKVLPFPAKNYPFEIFIRATPGSSQVYNKNSTLQFVVKKCRFFAEDMKSCKMSEIIFEVHKNQINNSYLDQPTRHPTFNNKPCRNPCHLPPNLHTL